MITFLIYIVLITISSGHGARILGVYPFPAYSHYKLGDVILKELARRGHEVTVISPYKEKYLPKNFSQILVDGIIEDAKTMKSTLFHQSDFNIFEKVFELDTIGINFTNLTLSQPNVRKLLKEERNFDLVIFHQFMSDAYNGFCHHFKTPCVAISSMTAPAWINNKVGNSGPPSYVPQLFVNFAADMTFFQRAFNTFVYILINLSHSFYLYPTQNRLLQTSFPDSPHLDDLYYNVSLILVNSHISINDVAPTLPNVIHIAGAHIAPPRALPVELQKYLDNAIDGVIFFSMGSNLKSKDIPEEKIKSILKVFSNLKQKVLWKWEDKILPNQPSNVKIGEWFPQQDVLAHPNVVLFITHGGMMSTIEAVYNGVPVLGIPVFSDQGLNMIRAEVAGYGKCLFYNNLNEDSFSAAVNEILTNPRFRENAKKRSLIMKDQVVKPLDNAIFWIEYVLRHQGAPHLKSAALKLSWYQYYLLDVIGCAILVLITLLFLAKLLVKAVCPFSLSTRGKEKQY